MSDNAKLNAKLAAYSKSPQEHLDLSGIGLNLADVKKVAAFLPKW
jgi:hypothetical protein